MTDLTREDPQFELFQALQAESYWQAFTAVPKHAIDKDGLVEVDIQGGLDE